MNTIQTQILNCKTVAELKALNLNDENSIETAVVTLLINTLCDDSDYDMKNEQIAVNKDVDGNWYVTVEDDGTNASVENVFDVESWYDEDWNETEDTYVDQHNSQYRVHFSL